MKLNKYKLLICAAIIGCVTMLSCTKENVDTANSVDDPINPEVIEVDGASCDELLVLNSSGININETGSAVLFKTACSENITNTDHNYLIYANSFDLWGGQAHIYFNSDGIPGFGIGSDGVPEVGDVLTQYSVGQYRALMVESDQSTLWKLSDDTEFIIEHVGDEVGEFIGGLLSGTITNEVGDSSSISGSFCVPIIEVCE